MASKGLAALPRIDRDALGRGCGREGSGALPLPRAAVISTRLRLPMISAVERPVLGTVNHDLAVNTPALVKLVAA